MDDLEKSVSDNENIDVNEDANEGDDNEVIKNKSSTNQSTGESDVESDLDDTDRESDANSVLDGDDNEISDAETDSDYDGDEVNEKDTTVKNSKKAESGDDIIKEYLQPSLEDHYKNKNRSDDESSEYETDDEDQFKKLDHSRDRLTDIHKNLQSINYIEVEQLSKITRDELGRIIDDNHQTVPILSKYERTRILGLRTKQLNNGSNPFINVEEDIIDGYIIAERELLEKKIPFIIKRPISNNKFEYWRLEDLEIV
jgi:DNA-directed RNA polymerase I, II, and III subunit RPABC2